MIVFVKLSTVTTQCEYLEINENLVTVKIRVHWKVFESQKKP